MIRRALRRLVDLVVFAAWDGAWAFRPMPLCLLDRIDADPFLALCPCQLCANNFRAIYYRGALAHASPRVWRYLEQRRPSVVFLWRVGYRHHPEIGAPA